MKTAKFVMNAGFFFLLATASCRLQGDEPQPRLSPAVRVAVLHPTVVAPIVKEGQITAVGRLRLGFRVSGVVRTVLARQGDAVQKGQALADLDNADATSALQMAEADLRQANVEFESVNRLVTSGSLSPHEADVALDKQVRARSLQEQAHQSLLDTHLSSPVSGRVFERLAEPGEVVGPGSAVLVVDEEGAPCVRVAVNERDLERIRLDERVDVSRAGEVISSALAGHVTSISGAPDVHDGLYTVEVRASDGSWSHLPLGTRVSLAFVEDNPNLVMSVPLEATVRRLDHDTVFVIARTGGHASAHERAVVLGRSEGTRVALRSGLRDGEEIITEGAYFLEEGDSVRVVE